MIKILAKLVISGSALFGIASLNSPLFPKAIEGEHRNLKSKERKTADSITKFEDISIYAKEHGCCSFVFSKSWDKKEVYSPEKFVSEEQLKPTEFIQKTHEIKTWKEKMISDVNNNKSKCAEGKTLTFFYYDDTGIFNVTTPPKKQFKAN